MLDSDAIVVGGREKNGMRLTGRKKDINPESPEMQTSVLKAF
jgi:hypothetical protein